MATTWCLAVAVASVQAFSPASFKQQRIALRADVVDVEEAPPASTETSPKDELMSVISATGPPGAKLSSDLRTSILETLMKLEPTNPTDSPATSPIINGIWDVAFSGYAPGPLASPTRPLALFLYAGGYTPGLAGLSILRSLPESLVDVGDLTLTITRDQPRCEASASVAFAGMGSQKLTAKTSLLAESGVRLKETYTELDLLGRKLDVPDRLRYARTLYVTYLDEDVMVVRDDSGVPEVLIRKSMPDFLEEGVPSSDEEDTAPGAG